VDHGGAAKSTVAHPPEHGMQALRLAGSHREGWRRERGTWRCRGALTGDKAVVKRPGDGGKAVVIHGTRWGELQHERGEKEGGVGCSEVRRGWGTFYRCRGGGR
jgi:hypothetical protein